MLTKKNENEMYRMRQSGSTLQQIANYFGVSREGIRQALVKRYGSSGLPGLLTMAQVSRLTGYKRSDVGKLKRRGIIKPARVVGNGRTLWTEDTVDLIKQYMGSRFCRVCGKSLPEGHWMFCSRPCRIEGSKISNRPQEQKKQQKKRMARYFAKKAAERYRNSLYVVRKKCIVPMGTVLKVLSIGKTKRHLKVEWRGKTIEIPTGCLKRIPKDVSDTNTVKL